MTHTLTIEEQKTIIDLLQKAEPHCKNIIFYRTLIYFTINDNKYIYESPILKEINSWNNYYYSEGNKVFERSEILTEMNQKLQALTEKTIDTFKTYNNRLFKEQSQYLWLALEEKNKMLNAFFHFQLGTTREASLLSNYPASRDFWTALEKIEKIVSKAKYRKE